MARRARTRQCNGVVPRHFSLMLLCALALLSSGHARAEPHGPPVPDLHKVNWQERHAVAPTSAGEAILTLEPGLQRQAERLLRDARPLQGAAVALDVETGKVLVWSEHRAPGQHSLLFEARAPAASLFKLVTTVALFERGRIHPRRSVCIDGGQHGIYPRHLEPATGGEAVCAPFFEALGHSRNAVYAQLAHQHLLASDLLEVAQQLGFNRPLPFDAEVPLGTLELSGGDLNFARAAAGFADSRLTPLGAAYLSYLVATGGRAARISIVERAGDYRAPRERQNLGQVLSSTTAWRLSRMMELTVHGGTSLSAFSDEVGRSYLGSIRVAGKTGTLQPTPGSPTTSWFTGFAPSRRPRVVVAVLLQNGPIWHRKANELARDLLRRYFADQGVSGITAP